MVMPQTSAQHLTLHVFEQDGGWHWGIVMPRLAGTGFKVLAYSKLRFAKEVDARHDGNRAFDALAQDQFVQCGS